MLYLIKLNIILALLCLLFQVVMHRDTFFGVRRAMLWGIYLTATLLPLWDVQQWLQGRTLTMNMASDYATHVLPTLEVTAGRVASMGVEQAEPGCGMWFVGLLAIWGLIYLIPVVWMTLRLMWQVAYIIYLRCTCPSSFMGEEALFYRYPRPCSPFSFGPWIFLHPDGMDKQTLKEVLVHEQTHVRGWHTLDIIVAQLFCILFWWNPATWVLRREVRLNLEFIADAAVIGKLVDKRTYQYRLLGFATQTNVATITNNFNVLPLKRRIVMMNLRRTGRTGMMKYILFVPVAATLLLLSNVDALARTIGEEVQSPINGVIDMVTTTTTDDGEPIFVKVEKMPQFPGGEEAFYKFLYEHIKYPAIAQECGFVGQLYVQFVIEQDGRITHVEAVDTLPFTKDATYVLPVIVKQHKKGSVSSTEIETETTDPSLKWEAVRVVSLMPRWKPGEQNGKKVRVRYTLPVSFMLQ